MCVCVCVCVHAWTCACARVCVCTSVSMDTCTCVVRRAQVPREAVHEQAGCIEREQRTQVVQAVGEAVQTAEGACGGAQQRTLPALLKKLLEVGAEGTLPAQHVRWI